MRSPANVAQGTSARLKLALAGTGLALLVLLLLTPLAWRRLKIAYFARKLEQAAPDPQSHALYWALSLANTGEAAVPALLVSLRHEKSHIRAAAALNLGCVRRIAGDDISAEVVAALHRAGADDPDRTVRIAAGCGLYSRGELSDALPYLAEALDLEPGDLFSGMKRKLAVEHRIREAVEALLADFREHRGEKAGWALDGLCDVVGEEIESLPELVRWQREHAAAGLTPPRKSAVLAEIEAWWQDHKTDFRALQDVLKDPGVLGEY